MRRTIAYACVCTVLLGSRALAADDTAQPPSAPGPMKVERVSDGFAVAPDFKVTRIGGKTGEMAGVYGGWMIDNTLLLGAGADWLTSGSNVRGLAYGGFVAEWLQRTDRPLGYSLRGLVGFGEATFNDNVTVVTREFDRDGRVVPAPFDRTPTLTTTTIPVRFRRDFFVAEPQANVLVRLSPRMRINVGAGYRFIGADNRSSDVANRLKGVTGTVAFQIGGSSSRPVSPP